MLLVTWQALHAKLPYAACVQDNAITHAVRTLCCLAAHKLGICNPLCHGRAGLHVDV